MFNIVQPKGLNMLYKQDIYNSDTILSQILKSTVKMDGLLHKLGQHGTEEAAQNLVKLTFILCYIYIFVGRNQSLGDLVGRFETFHTHMYNQGLLRASMAKRRPLLACMMRLLDSKRNMMQTRN